jgi:hypothetical protein
MAGQMTTGRGPALVLMAAGIGSRYGGLKQMDSLGPNGEVIVDYSAYDAIRAGFGKLIMVIRKDMEALFREKIGDRIARSIEVEYAFQDLAALPPGFTVPEGRTKPWGTAHAVLAAGHGVTGPFGVINSDDYYGLGALQVLAGALQTMKSEGGVVSCCNVAYSVENTLSEHGHVTRGICLRKPDGYLAEIVERKKVQAFPEGIKYALDDDRTWEPVPADALSSMNVWGFTADILPVLEERFVSFLREHGREKSSEFILPAEVGELVRAKRVAVEVLRTEEKWFGVTYKEDKPIAQSSIRELIAAGKYPEKLWT